MFLQDASVTSLENALPSQIVYLQNNRKACNMHPTACAYPSQDRSARQSLPVTGTSLQLAAIDLCMTAGILAAQLVNIGTYNIRPWGWRLSVGLAAVPGTILLLGGLFLPESPNSLIERGQFEKGRQVLQRIRGTHEVEAEYQTIVTAQQVVFFAACLMQKAECDACARSLAQCV